MIVSPSFSSAASPWGVPCLTTLPSAGSEMPLWNLSIYEKLFEEINRQIESHGLLVREKAIVDATIVESSRRPRKVIEVMAEDRSEEGPSSEAPSRQITYSDDHDATWVRKGKKPY